MPFSESHSATQKIFFYTQNLKYKKHSKNACIWTNTLIFKCQNDEMKVKYHQWRLFFYEGSLSLALIDSVLEHEYEGYEGKMGV